MTRTKDKDKDKDTLSYNDSSIKPTFSLYTLLLVELFQVVGGTYPNRTYVFSSPAVLWEVVARVLVFVIAPVAIHILIGLKEVPQVIQVWSCMSKFRPKGHKVLLG